MEIPKNGYWHCKVNVDGHESTSTDLTYSRLVKEIITPYVNNNVFFIGSLQILNRESIFRITILHSINEAKYYNGNKQELSSDNYLTGEKKYRTVKNYYNIFNLMDKANGEVINYTQQIFSCYELKENKQNSETSPINIFAPQNTQIQSQQQKQFQTQEQIQNNIWNLQKAFSEFREVCNEAKILNNTELKEAQDALDELSPNSDERFINLKSHQV
jgi:hypothetical protein